MQVWGFRLIHLTKLGRGGVAGTNTAPTITSTPRTSTRQGNLYTYQVQATDPEGDRLTYSLVSRATQNQWVELSFRLTLDILQPGF
jgi:hypothetical protein